MGCPMSKSWTYLAVEAPDKSSAEHRQRVHINDFAGYTPGILNLY